MPRTCSFIEKILTNKDQWDVNPKLKHLTASQAKLEYKKYWNSISNFPLCATHFLDLNL